MVIIKRVDFIHAINVLHHSNTNMYKNTNKRGIDDMISNEQLNFVKGLEGKTTESRLRARQYEIEMETQVAQFEAEMEALMAMFDESTEEEVVTVEELTVEDVEIALASIDTYRGLELDVNIDEYTWMNENIKMSDVLGRAYKAHDDSNIIDVLALTLQMSTGNVRLMIRNGLGIKRGTDYQNMQREYLECVEEDFKNGLCEDLLNYLQLRKIDVFYKSLLSYVKNRISTEPLSNNKNELTFYVIYDDLRKQLKYDNYTGGMSDPSIKTKLKLLCDLHLLTNITNERMTPRALHVANNFKKNVSKTISEDHRKHIEANRRNHYVLHDLSPQTQAIAMGVPVVEKKYNLRQKSKTAVSLALVHGEDNGVVAQKEANINPIALKNFMDAANILLEKQRYYTEDQLRKQYVKKNHKITKKDAILLTAEYLAGVNMRVGAVRQRVNKQAREQYSLPAKIKSNSIIYVLEEDK